jgi:hypothetical protein
MGKLIVGEEFYCCKCGCKGIPVVRQTGKERGAGHLKKLWCLKCNAETNHAECIVGSKYTKEDFQIEFKYGNFDENQQRKITYGQLRDKLMREGVNIYEE